MASSVAAAIGTVLVMFLYTSLQAQARMAVRADVQQQGIMASNRIVKDLQSTVLGGVSIRKCVNGDPANPEVLCLHPLIDVATNDPPAQVFSRQLVVYSWTPGQGRIVRGLYPENPGAPTPTPFKALRVDQAGLLWLTQNPPAAVARFGGDITALNVSSPAAPPFVGTPLTVTLSLSRLVRDKPYDYRVQRTVSLRNSD